MLRHAKKGRSRPVFYRIDQTPPPKQWYNKRVGWFGKFLTMTLVLGFSGASVAGYMHVQKNVKTLSSQSTKQSDLTKATPTLAASSEIQNIVELQPLLDKWVAQHPKQKWGIVAKSVSGPSFEARINPDKEFESASIYKLFLVLPLFNQIAVEHHKNINVTVNGGQKSIATCVDLMLRLSNNECGKALGYYLNWNNADETLKRGGFSHTVFKESNNLRTSAGDTASFMEALNGDMFNRAAKDTIMRSLREQRWRDGIPAGCPGCIVANKTGSLDNVMHDAAIVQYKGGTYVLTIFSEGGSFKQIAELTGQIQQKILDTTRTQR